MGIHAKRMANKLAVPKWGTCIPLPFFYIQDDDVAIKGLKGCMRLLAQESIKSELEVQGIHTGNQ